MEVKAIYRYVRMSAFKMRDVTREIQGKAVAAALDIVAFSPKKAAFFVQKTLKSAVANAENNHNLRAEKLVVKEAVAGEGATIKRFIPKARRTDPKAHLPHIHHPDRRNRNQKTPA